MIKKIICIALFAIMLSSSFVGNASYGTAVLDGYDEYAGLFKTLGVFPTSFEDAEKEVSRGEFVLMLTQLMKVSDPPGEESPFSDVLISGELASAVNAALNLKIISPGQNFYPDSAVTSIEAVKMVVTALGYGDEAIARGGYPSGYVSVAHRIGIDSNFAKTPMNVSQTVCLLGQMCETYVNEITAITHDDNGYGYSATQRSTFLYYYQKIYAVSGVVEATQESYLDDSTSSLSPRRISIRENQFELEEGVECHLGHRVSAFIKDGDGLYDKVIYCVSKNNKAITLIPDNDIKMNGTSIEYITDSNKEKRLICDSQYSVLYNGKAYEKFVKSDIEIKEGRVEIIDNDSDGRYDVISILEPTYLVVDYVDAINGIIYDENFTNNIFLNNDDILYTSDVSLKNINGGDVLEVFVSKDGKYAQLHLLKNRFSGIVEGYTSDGELVFEGELYPSTSYFEKYYCAIITPGMEVTVIINDSNQCVGLRSYDSGNVRYGYLDDIKEKSGIDSTVSAKIFDESGEVRVIDFSDKMRVNDDVVSAKEAMNLLGNEKGNLVRYKVDSYGKIRTVGTQEDEYGLCVPSKDGADVLKRYDFPGYDTTTKIPYKVTGYFVPHFIIDSGTKIFCISESETDDEKRFSIGNGVNFLANDTQVESSSLYAYNVNEVGRADALLYKTDSYAATIDETSKSGLVSKFVKVLDDEGDEAYKIEVYYSNSFNTYMIETNSIFITDGDSTFVPGDFIRFNVDDNGYVKAISKDFDYKTKTVLGSTQDNTRNHYYYGDVYLLGDSSTAIRRPDGTLMYIPMAVNDCGYVNGGNVSTVSNDVIKTYKHVGEACSKILVKCYYSSPQAIYIYEN